MSDNSRFCIIFAEQERLFLPRNERMIDMKDQYITKIIELLHKCNDPSLLDLIFQLLDKSQKA